MLIIGEAVYAWGRHCMGSLCTFPSGFWEPKATPNKIKSESNNTLKKKKPIFKRKWKVDLRGEEEENTSCWPCRLYYINRGLGKIDRSVNYWIYLESKKTEPREFPRIWCLRRRIDCQSPHFNKIWKPSTLLWNFSFCHKTPPISSLQNTYVEINQSCSWDL